MAPVWSCDLDCNIQTKPHLKFDFNWPFGFWKYLFEYIDGSQICAALHEGQWETLTLDIVSLGY